MNMKTTFALMLGLLLLESGVAMGQVCAGVFQGACASKDGILVIMIDKNNAVHGCHCKHLGSGRGTPISEKPNANGMVPIGPTKSLGDVRKFRATGETDPCIEWSTGGTPSYYCW